ncbi:MAG: glycosyltransferase family 2 protein [Acidimicrobiia bacterium]|nr:glycosyltransferase family 2 protein [Acidimicrobiia bacterium]
MPHSPHTGVSILMPAHQLETTISDNIDRVVAVVRDWELPEIIVIDDGSTDDTRGFADKAAAGSSVVTVVGYDVNRGKGGALKEGFAHATGKTIVFLDADLDLPPEQLPAFLDTFRESDVDVLVGAKRSAMVPGRYPALRRILSLTFAAVNRILFRLPVRETQTGLKVFRRAALEDTLPRLETNRYAFDLELLARIRKAGGSMTEAPVSLSPGSSGGLSLTTLWEMGRDTLRIWFRSFSW